MNYMDPSEKNEFQLFHIEMRRLTNPRLIYPTFIYEDGKIIGKNPPYRRPRTGDEIEGKRNIRFAKRNRVKALKEAQCQTS